MKTEIPRTSSETIRKITPQEAPLQDTTVDRQCSEDRHPSVPVVSAFPSEPPLLKLQLTVRPELQRLDATEEYGMWVAITVSADRTVKLEDVPATPLNIVVILDNSAYASPDSLKNACQSVVDLATKLTHPKDRLAIICTSPAEAWKSSRSGYVLRDLVAVDVIAIQKALRVAVHARLNIPPQGLDMDRTLAGAFHILANGEDMDRTGGLFCHVVLMTANAEACASSAQCSAPVCIHVIQTSVVAWRQIASPCTGRLITSNGFSASVKDRIAHLLYDARSRLLTGSITHVVIEVEAVDSCCSIEEVVGKQQFAVLSPGEVCNVLVKVNVKRCMSSPTSITETLFAELENLLGVVTTELLKVTITYEHSIFPIDTTLRTTAVCELPRYDTSSVWVNATLTTPLRSERYHAQSEVFQKLLLCTSASRHPKNAIASLQSLQIPAAVGGNLLVLLESIKTELSYQLHVMNMYKMTISSEEDVQYCNDGWTAKQTADAFPETTLVPAQQALVSIPESPDSGKTIIHKEHTSQPEEDENDAARRIWKNMRRDSKSAGDLLASKTNTMGVVDDGRLAAIQKQALRSKRSIGTDTLRSLSFGTGSGAYPSRYAPWA